MAPLEFVSSAMLFNSRPFQNCQRDACVFCNVRQPQSFFRQYLSACARSQTLPHHSLLHSCGLHVFRACSVHASLYIAQFGTCFALCYGCVACLYIPGVVACLFLCSVCDLQPMRAGWHSAPGRLLQQVPPQQAHRKKVWRLAYASSGKHCASCSEDCTVRWA